jgi:hypothetical protein
MIPSSVAIDLPCSPKTEIPRKPAPSATSSPYSHAGFLVSHVHDSERIKTLYGSVLGGEGMTVLTGGACQLTGLPEPAIQILPTGLGSAVRSALRTAP